ncbi:symporter [Kordiimonas sediminis]|uniref:Symporter n=1 Tax=Kordiimonas sediminis TaxID=1735581 RepID=A0A919AR06_9PROT|nr:bile acid:sodium symporter [Kordiimonas sediminis]GHF20573.1 symporter [Kordiimonas sediminis]
MPNGLEAIDSAIVAIEPVTQLGLALILIIVMFSVALGLGIGDFRLVSKRPMAVFIGAAAQMVGLPLMTLLLIKVIPLPASVALGMIIVASCPGGNVSNFYTVLARGDAAYSVTLTTISSLAGVVWVPFSILFWSSFHAPVESLVDAIALDKVTFILRIVGLLGVPLLLGMWIRHKRPDLARKIQKHAVPGSVILLLMVILIALFDNVELFTDFGPLLLPVVAGHNALAFLLGWGVGWVFVASGKDRRALTFEVGLQNAGLGLLIILSHFEHAAGAAVVTAMWSMWHFVGGFSVLALYRIRDKIAKRPE